LRCDWVPRSARVPNGSVAVIRALAYGIGGATAILVAKADFKMIHTAVLSGLKRSIDRELAGADA
jgi:hypothetical protein